MIFDSIRWRLQLWHGLILVVVLAGFGVTAYQVARENQFRRIDQDLDQRLMALLRPQPRDRGGGPPDHGFGGPPGEGPNALEGFPDQQQREPPHGRGPEGPFSSPRVIAEIRATVQGGGAIDSSQTNTFYYVFWDQKGGLLASSPGAPTNVPPPAAVLAGRATDEAGVRDNPRGPRDMPAEMRTRGRMRELFRVLPGGQCLLIGRALNADLAALRRLALGLTVAGISVLALGLAGGWWVATRAIRPIEDISSAAVRIAGGDLSHRINAADTDSELGRLAGVLNSTFARLEAAFAQHTRFTSDASHELRTPVSVILTQTQTALARERGSDEYREALEACQRAARRMHSLTDSLLELARLDAGQEPMKRERFDLASVARECAELVQPLAERRGIKLQLNLPKTECLGDADRISQVVTNLLSNAITFNRDQGQVQVSVEADKTSAVLRVTDSGIGISAEDLPHIFERFYRADKSRSRTGGHNGLGLAICKAIVDAHGGSLDATSQPDAGSTFMVKLPRE